MAMAHDLANFGAIVNTKVCAEFEILEVKVPLSFFGTVHFSSRVDRR
jgi:hypothetical protein